MGIRKILLADKDKEYGNALANAISNLHNEFEITIMNLEKLGMVGFDNIDIFQDYDLVLIGEHPAEEAGKMSPKILNRNKLVILTEYRTENVIKQSQNEERDFWFIYKYISISDMASELNYLIGFITGKKSFMRKSFDTNIIGFYSICGGVGKSVISIATSRELCRYHDKKVLYLNLEEISSSDLFIKNSSGNRTIGDYLYFLLEKQNENLCIHLEGFTSSDEFGVETFYPSSGRNDLKYLSKDELNYFIKIISDSCRYDYVILDLNCDLSAETLLLMNHCSKTFLIQTENPITVYKNNKLISFMSKNNSLKYPEGFIVVVNKADNSFVDNEYQKEFYFQSLKKIYIEKDDNSFHYTKNHLEININNAFGIGIKAIADEILSSEIMQKQSIL